MQIHKGVGVFEKLPNAVVTTGTFDGLHLGHKQILTKLIEVGKQNCLDTVVMTFFPHPRIVLFPDQELKLINNIDENIQLFKNYDIDHLIIQPFDKQFSRIKSLDYIRDILIQKIGLTELVIGENHHFGRNREGSVNNLEELADLYAFKIHEVNSYKMRGKEVSSTKIRNAISNGNIKLANDYLGYNLQLSGLVVKGKGVGHTIGFPTANIKIENKNKIIPLQGVYSVLVYHDQQQFQGMLNIGTNPTFSNKTVSIEVNIFDFNKQIYDEHLTVEFVDRIRNEKKFQNIDQLKKQLSEDKIMSLNLLS